MLINIYRPHSFADTAVRIACLPTNPTVAAKELNVPNIREGLVSYRPTVVGWGKDLTRKEGFEGVQERVGSSIQQKLTLPVLSDEECGRRFFEPRQDQICAGGEEGKEICTVSVCTPPPLPPPPQKRRTTKQRKQQLN